MDAADVVKPACPPFGPELHSCLEEHSLKGEDKQQHRERECKRETDREREISPLLSFSHFDLFIFPALYQYIF